MLLMPELLINAHKLQTLSFYWLLYTSIDHVTYFIYLFFKYILRICCTEQEEKGARKPKNNNK